MMRLCARSLSTYAFSKSPVKRSRDDAERQLGLLVDSSGAFASFAFAWIDRQSRWRKTRSRSMSSSDAPSAAVRTMTPPSFTSRLLEDLLQALALVVVEPARDAEPLALRDEDDEPAGKRDLRRQPGALRLHRVLHRLDEDRLAAC